MSLLVSIHDVTPAHAAGVLHLWDLCAARGLAPALLVVPDWHGRWPLGEHPRFVRWLRDRADEGAEIVLHGERHEPGEFRLLDRAAARARIDRGLRVLRVLGLQPVGFVPPGWLAREEGHAAAGDAGLGFSEDDRTLRMLPAGRRVASPVVRWSASTSFRAWGSVAVARGRWILQRRASYPRLAFHPQDLDHTRTRRSLAATLDRWLGRHHPLGYGALRSDLLADPASGGA